MDTKAEKAELRDRIGSALAALDPDERLRRSAQLSKQLSAMGVFTGRNGHLMGYLPFGHEVDVTPAFWLAWSYGRGVCVPETDWGRKTIRPVAFTPGSPVRPGKHGVPEVESGETVPDPSIAVVLVPGIAFDDANARLGRGGGFYDRFLARLATGDAERPLFIGVCFTEQRVEALPAEGHDVRMDAVIDV